MKKFLALAVMFAMCTAFVGCESKPAEKKTEKKVESKEGETKPGETTPMEGATTPTEEGKTE